MHRYICHFYLPTRIGNRAFLLYPINFQTLRSPDRLSANVNVLTRSGEFLLLSESGSVFLPYLLFFAQESFSATVRLKTLFSAVLSLSLQKYP